MCITAGFMSRLAVPDRQPQREVNITVGQAERTESKEIAMTDPVPSLVLDLLEWLAAKPRPYSEVLEIWRTSCPRLPVWETASDHGWLEQRHSLGSEALVAVSAKGREHLYKARPAAQARELKVVQVRSPQGETTNA
jgi:hypothetical protein